MTEAILMFWIMDVMNLPFMEMFDTTYPLNGQFWAYALFVLIMLIDARSK